MSKGPGQSKARDRERAWEGIVEQGPVRADKWLHENLAGYSLAAGRDLFDQGLVRVEGRRIKKGAKLAEGDVVEVRGAAVGEFPAAEDAPLEAVYEDDEIIVVDKPAGMPTHPLAPHETGTLVNAALHHWPDLRGVGDKPLEPGLVHRLDVKTAGLVMLARKAETLAYLKNEVKKHRLGKRYLALVKGAPRRPSGEIDFPLGRHPADPGLMVVAREEHPIRGRALAAITRYRVADSDGRFSLLELDLITGVMHQLRVHLAALGVPILGDDRYGPNPDPGSPAYALLAHRLSFVTPRGEKISVTSRQTLSLKDAQEFIKS